APDPANEAEREDRYRALIRAIDVLPERERMVLVLFYYEEQPLKEIAALLGVTESRVSQLQGQALTRLNARLRSWPPSGPTGRRPPYGRRSAPRPGGDSMPPQRPGRIAPPGTAAAPGGRPRSIRVSPAVHPTGLPPKQ